jgi:hypothetical protein
MLHDMLEMTREKRKPPRDPHHLFITTAHARAFPLSFSNDALEFTLLGFNLPQSRVQAANSLFEPGNSRRDCSLLCMVPRGLGIPPVRCRLARTRRTRSFDRNTETLLKPRSIPAKRFAFESRFVPLFKGFVALLKGFVALLKGFVALLKGFLALSKGLLALSKGFLALSKGFVQLAYQRVPFLAFVANSHRVIRSNHIHITSCSVTTASPFSDRNVMSLKYPRKRTRVDRHDLTYGTLCVLAATPRCHSI